MRIKREKITRILFFMGGVLLNYYWMRKLLRLYEEEVYSLKEKNEYIWRQFNRNTDKMDIMLKWKQLNQNKILVEQWFVSRGYKKIAVYGLGEIGKALVKEILNSDIEVSYIIDKNINGVSYRGIPVVNLKCVLQEVDCVVVTTMRNFEEVQEEMEKKGRFRLVAFKDMIEEMEINEVGE